MYKRYAVVIFEGQEKGRLWQEIGVEYQQKKKSALLFVGVLSALVILTLA